MYSAVICMFFRTVNILHFRFHRVFYTRRGRIRIDAQRYNRLVYSDGAKNGYSVKFRNINELF